MRVIETAEQFVTFTRSYVEENKVIVIPLVVDPNVHPSNNTLSLLYVRCLKSKHRFILIFDHSEGLSLEPECISFFGKSGVSILTSDKKILSHIFGFYDNIFDMSIIPYLAGKSVAEANYGTNTHKHFYINFSSRPALNKVVPIVKHFEMCEKISDNLLSTFENIPKDVYTFYNDTVIPSFAKIERVGLKTHDKLLFSEYNLYTSTGRPSNRYGGTNFAALNKSDGTRKQFISRHTDGALLQFDYSAYHIKLIGEHIGYDMPDDAHTYLGQQYFDKDTLTDDEYEESKKISFQFLYGRIPDDIANAIPYFDKVREFVGVLWDEIQEKGYITSPVSNRKIFKSNIIPINPEKMFNYFIQLLETETNCLVLEQIHEYIANYKTKLVLYTYDSFLFDIVLSDGKEFFRKLKDIIEQGGKYPTKSYIGHNYDELIEKRF